MSNMTTIRRSANRAQKMPSDAQRPGNLHEHLARMEMVGRPQGGIGFERLVWAPDPVHGYVLGDIVDIRSDSLSITRRNDGKTVEVRADDVFPADASKDTTVDDNCALMYLNEGSLLENSRRRFINKHHIYTYVANILISINPYADVPDLYSTKTMVSYRGKSIGQLPPHVYAIADKAFRDMRRHGRSQSILVSGESGAGKTESQKAILRYLCENWGQTAGPIQQRLLETNPILEAFGNAKTSRNNNSSRFGKFVEIHFDNKNLVTGGHVSHYLLEKSRIVGQSEGERNYHIFYQLIAGSDADMYKLYALAPPDRFHYLRRGCVDFFARPGNERGINADRLAPKAQTRVDPIVDDAADFKRLLSCLEKCGLNEGMRKQVLSTVAGVLHLGNVDFVAVEEGGKDGSRVSPGESEKSAIRAAGMFGIDVQQLRLALTTRAMQPSRGGMKGTLILVPLKPAEASAARDALAKAIYSRLFDWIVATINKSIPFTNSHNYIGVLDIAGFEYFTINSFEQFCINYCNEKLQNFFNERILKEEQELYAKEGLGVDRIEFADNQDCIDLFEKKGSGMLDLLDEEMRLPKPLSAHFTQNVHQANQKHFRLDTPRKSLLKEHRGMRDEDGLLVRHFAGTVCYQTAGFLEKNNDALHASLEAVMEMSEMPVMKLLFAPPATSEATVPSRTRLIVPSVGSKFRSQLAQLIEKLALTGTHFVRCVKPNATMSPWKFDGAAVLGQLRCAGMGAVLRLMHSGYPSRTGFKELYDMYSAVLPPELARLDPRLFCKCLFRVLGLNTTDFKFGLTKVFFRPAKFAEFDQLLRQDPAAMAILVSKVKKWLIGVRWRKAQYGAWSVIKLKNKIVWRGDQLRTIQRYARGYLTRQKLLPRLSLYRKIVALKKRGAEMQSIVEKLGPNSKDGWGKEVDSTQQNIIQLLYQCKKREMELDACAKNYEECLRRVDKIINALRGQMAADEADRLARIERQIKMDREREEREKIEERKNIEMREENENRRREMEEERQRAEKTAMDEMKKRAVREEQERMDALMAARMEEQERLDGQLAGRLAAEKGGDATLIQQQITSASSSYSSSTSSGNNNDRRNSKYDLSSWKYAELRDTINTSNDMDLLLACKEEFHRRLRYFNAWKQKNQTDKEKAEDARRIPLSLMNTSPFPPPPSFSSLSSSWPSTASSSSSLSSSTRAPLLNAALTHQRYFKVPFNARCGQKTIPAGENTEYGSGQQGMWYGHFNGQWVQRQIELHPDRQPLLLIAGRDDLQMCELPLDQTPLPLKKGAEILEHEFETVWAHLGGQPMPRWNP